EATEDAEPPLDPVTRSREAIQIEEETAKVRRDKRSQGFVFRRLDRDRPVVAIPCEPLDLVEQHRLTDTSQSSQEQALLGPSLLHAPEEDARLLENRVSPDQFGRR